MDEAADRDDRQADCCLIAVSCIWSLQRRPTTGTSSRSGSRSSRGRKADGGPRAGRGAATGRRTGTSNLASESDGSSRSSGFAGEDDGGSPGKIASITAYFHPSGGAAGAVATAKSPGRATNTYGGESAAASAEAGRPSGSAAPVAVRVEGPLRTAVAALEAAASDTAAQAELTTLRARVAQLESQLQVRPDGHTRPRAPRVLNAGLDVSAGRSGAQDAKHASADAERQLKQFNAENARLLERSKQVRCINCTGRNLLCVLNWRWS